MTEQDIHNYLIDILSMKPNEYFDYNKNKQVLNQYSKEELIDLCLISLDIIIEKNLKGEVKHEFT